MRDRSANALRGGRGEGGFTVVEVLVALVVLLVGVYAMINVFPRSYVAVDASQMRTTASQLAESELAFWRLHPESLPDEIVATDYDGNVIEAMQAGAPTEANNATGVGMLLPLPQSNIPLLPGSSTYKWPVVTGQLFAILNQEPGAVYTPTDLTPCAVNAVQGQIDHNSGYHQLVANPNWQPNSMYLPRTIIGEQVDIRRLNTTSAGIPFYLLSQAPLDKLRYEHISGPTGVTDNPVYVDVYDARAWTYVEPTAPPTQDLGPRQFTYDSASKLLYFGPRDPTNHLSMEMNDRQFKLDYTAVGTGGALVRIFGKTVRVAGNTGSANPTGVASSALDWVPADPHTMQIHERLIPLTDAEYQARELERTDPTARRNVYYVNDPTAVITGAIQFPLILQVDPKPTDITLVKVDYRVLDWQILSFDVQVPPSGVVELPVKGLKSSGYTNLPRQPRPQPVAKGIRVWYDAATGKVISPSYEDSNPLTWAFVVAVDRQNGEVLTERTTTAWPDNAYMRRSSLPRVNYREGRIQFNYYAFKRDDGTYVPDPNEVHGTWVNGVDTPDRSGRTYRIFVRAEADWAVQLMMAARLYGRAANGVPGGYQFNAAEALLTYGWQWNAGTDKTSIDATRQVYFPLSEAGQTVVIDYYDRDGNFRDGEVHTISGPQLVQFANAGAASGYKWVCSLVEPLKRPPSSFGPITVRGVSLRVRAAWVASGRHATMDDVAKATADSVGLTTPRTPAKSLKEIWRQVLISSYVTRTPI